MKIPSHLCAGIALLVFATSSRAEVKVAMGFSAQDAGFKFKSVAAPATNDAATAAKWTIVDGVRDENGGELAVLHDGRVPAEEDQPQDNFFFNAGTDGGRIQVDLEKVISVKQVDSFSWHGGTRGPQVYKLYAADGAAAGFSAAPKKGTDPATVGWQLIADVDTRPKTGKGAGQHGVAVTNSDGALGKFRYLLFDIAATEHDDAFGNTFYSEIDVLDADGPAPLAITPPERIVKTFDSEDGKIRFAIDATAAPDLADWAEKELEPVVKKWYPQIVALLPSDGYQAPANITLTFKNGMGGIPAYATGAGVSLNAPWFRGELKREARGAVVHEMVHVVQNYWGTRRIPNAKPTPGWIVEGLADYVRWFLYEPESKGALITKNNIAKAKYDSSYRVTANFLDWVSRTYDKDLARKLNAAAREGRYSEQLWKEWTGKTLQELGDEWLKASQERLDAGKN